MGFEKWIFERKTWMGWISGSGGRPGNHVAPRATEKHEMPLQPLADSRAEAEIPGFTDVDCCTCNKIRTAWTPVPENENRSPSEYCTPTVH